jgi:hypothetical protein
MDALVRLLPQFAIDPGAVRDRVAAGERLGQRRLVVKTDRRECGAR